MNPLRTLSLMMMPTCSPHLSLVFKAALFGTAVCFIESPAFSEDLRKVSLSNIVSVSKTNNAAEESLNAPHNHQLKHALELVRKSHKRLHHEIRDYICTLDFRMRVNGQLSEMKTVQAKVRHDETIDDRLSLYLKFESPTSVRGREVLFCDRGDDDRMLVRRGGPRLAFLTMELEPTCELAMRGNLYPITEFGLRNLANRMLECAENELNEERCQVSVDHNADLDGHLCTLVEVVQNEKRDNAKFHQAKIYFSRDHHLPVRYEAYDWPQTNDGEPVLKEEYTYRNVELNVGLTEKDFDRDNRDYRFSKRD